MEGGNFIDYVKIFCKTGNGGKGSTHMRREKYAPTGGPDGGDGGRGGNIYLKGNSNYWTLMHLKYKRHVRAGHGGDGSGNLKSGSDGEDIILEVPLGTIAKDAETNEKLGAPGFQNPTPYLLETEAKKSNTSLFLPKDSFKSTSAPFWARIK